MTRRTHFHYVGSDGLWRSACSYKGYCVDGVWYNHDAGEFHSEGLIRHRHMLAAPQEVDCKVCMKNPKLKKLLEDLSPWPDSSVRDERMATYKDRHPSLEAERTAANYSRVYISARQFPRLHAGVGQ